MNETQETRIYIPFHVLPISYLSSA